MDSEFEKRVWQRVRGETPTVDLPALAAAEAMLTETYGNLLTCIPARCKQGLQCLHRHARDRYWCLAGLHALEDAPPPAGNNAAEKGNSYLTILRKCYCRTLQAAENYSRLSEDPSFGAVFTQLCADTRQDLYCILQMIGRLSTSRI